MSKKENDVYQKTEVPGFYKAHDGILINKDNDALAAYKKKKLKEHQIDNVITEMNNIKDDIAEIKNLLKGLVK